MYTYYIYIYVNTPAYTHIYIYIYINRHRSWCSLDWCPHGCLPYFNALNLSANIRAHGTGADNASRAFCRSRSAPSRVTRLAGLTRHADCRDCADMQPRNSPNHGRAGAGCMSSLRLRVWRTHVPSDCHQGGVI